MSDLGMNFDTNDLDIKNGDLYIVTGDSAIQQDLQQQLQLWLGEWFLDTTKGVPYKQHILVKNPSVDLVQADIIACATSVPGVVQIIDFSMSYDPIRRSCSISLDAQISTGEIITVQADVNNLTNGTAEGTKV